MTSIAERFREVVDSAPDAIALIAALGRYTYAELDRWSDAIAIDLVARNAPRELPIAIITRDPIALIPAALGVIKAGHFFVTIDAGDSEERIAKILEASGATTRLTDPITPLPLASPVEPRLSTIVPNDLVQLVFTSGTTGAPKAIANRQQGFVERLIAQSAITGRAAGERVSYTALPGFARATYEIFGSLLNGATLCAFDARTETLDDLANLVRRERISVLTLTPALFRRFMRSAPDDLDLSSVRKLRLGADVVTVPDVEAYKARFPPDCTLERSFNASETGLVLHMTLTHDTPVPGPLVPIGKPRRGVTVRVIDDEGNDVADGEVGELVAHGPHIAHGYWNAPELTAQKFAFDETGVTFFTGDLVKRDEAGLYYFVGRKDARLKIHGRRIDPLEIESALLACDGIREAAVVGKPDAHGELRLAAYVTMHEGKPLVARDVRTALRRTLPSFMIPSRIHALDALPVTAAGKVDRRALVNLVDPERPAAQKNEASDELERTLLEIWSRATGNPVSLHDDFFDDLGGDSIVAAHLVADVHRLLGRSMPLSLLLELNTVAGMADYLRTRAETDVERIVIALQREGSRPPLFCVAGKGGGVMTFRELATLLGPDQPFYGLTHHGFALDAYPKTFAAIATCYADAIRAIQPEGPYYLAGYSAGGAIAFDMARQMTRAGDAVAFVGLIDTSAKIERIASWRRALKYIELLWQQPKRYTLRYWRALARRIGLMPRNIPAGIAKWNRVFESIHRRDVLKPYEGRVTLFLASHGWGYDGTSRDLGWQALCEELDIVPIRGEHHTVFGEDVGSLAAAMNLELQKARQRAAS